MDVFRGLFSRATVEMCRDLVLRMELYSVIDPSLEDNRWKGRGVLPESLVYRLLHLPNLQDPLFPGSADIELFKGNCYRVQPKYNFL